jgi:RimJ/RimL family protein N-acetyltransferase
VVPIREIGPRYRERIKQHLLGLDPQDRYLRFGYAANDRQIRQYVDGLDFERDQVFGIFNRRLELIAMAHLAYPADFTVAGYAEFGVSVAKHARGRGFGARLFERAAVRAANVGVQQLYIHALCENLPMLRIARRAGAVVEQAGSEAAAHLKLPEATFRTRLDGLWAGQVGEVDYWLKAEASLMRDVLATAQEVREAVRAGRHKSGS